MKIPLEWLKEFVEVKISPEDLAKKLINHGTEVVAIEFHGQGLEGIVVGKIKTITPHDKNQQLFVCQVDIGKKLLQIVTDIQGLGVGDKVPVAQEGATIAKEIKITKTILHGIESFGILCKPHELGLSISDKIIKMPLDASVGKDVREVIGLGGYVIDIDILPNRGDCQSILGVAREVAAVTGKTLKKRVNKKLKEVNKKVTSEVLVKVLDKNLCPRYMARVIKGVKVKESPEWLKSRLLLSGNRPINNIVDITNYFLQELGQPMHAFDLNQIKGKQIVVRRAKEKEKMKTLDGTEHVLSEEMLVIADAEKPVALAGIMGGANSEISDATTDVLLESAFFDPISINKTSAKLKIRTDSSIRFGKSVDYAMVEEALDRAAALIAELGGGEVLKGKIDIQKEARKEQSVTLRHGRIAEILGFEIATSWVERILKSLGFAIKRGAKETWKVTIPFHRAFDVYREIDVIEEIIRIYGYDRVPLTMPNTSFVKKNVSSWDRFKTALSDVCRGSGLWEVSTFSMIGPKDLEMLNLPAESNLREVIHIANPLSIEESVMRPVMLSSLLRVFKHNLSHQMPEIAIFEVGKIFIEDAAHAPSETTSLAGLIKGKISGNSMEAYPSKEGALFYVKGVIENILETIGTANVEIREMPHMLLQTGKSAVVRVNQKEVGNFGKLNPLISKNYEVPEDTYYFELNLDLLFQMQGGVKKYVQLPKYPFVSRDIAVLVPKEVTNQQIISVISEAGGSLIEEVFLFDRYVGVPIPEGFANMAYRIIFRDRACTLKDEEVNARFEAICQALESNLKLQIRR
ncbi:MAG: phenylalanine--tRNA ligase subunit beta [Candidatus Saganbacteria bacterium]|nr:phenylalanine--tRNA ligase subunit beta [Candidatus Saganbacteria bacterium]